MRAWRLSKRNFQEAHTKSRYYVAETRPTRPKRNNKENIKLKRKRKLPKNYEGFFLDFYLHLKIMKEKQIVEERKKQRKAGPAATLDKFKQMAGSGVMLFTCDATCKN